MFFVLISGIDLERISHHAEAIFGGKYVAFVLFLSFVYTKIFILQFINAVFKNKALCYFGIEK